MKKIVLKDATYIDPFSLQFAKTHLLVSEDSQQALQMINTIPEDAYTNAHITVIDCNNLFVTKSFVCGHHHVYSALARGMGAPKKSPSNFYEILQYIWWTLDKALDSDMIRASAFATAIACAKNGVTFAIDHHASPFNIENSMDIIAHAFDTVGVGHLLCYEISDRDGKEAKIKGLAETEKYLKKNQGLVGLHASFTVEQDTLEAAVELAERTKSGIHIHVAEDLYDQEYTLNKYGKRVVERLNDVGATKFSKTIFGHCLHLNEKEKEIIAQSGVFVAQNIESNQNNNVGAFNGNGLGENIMLGTDGMHSDMIRSAQAAYFGGQATEKPDMLKIYKRLRMADHYLLVNQFKGNAANNLVVFDYDSPTEMNENNFLGHFFFGLTSKHIKHVIANGKLIVENGRINTINETEVLKFTREQGLRLWKAMQK